MTKESLKGLLDGREYPLEIPREMGKAIRAAGLVVVFGASDDLMEFRGAIHDERGANEGTECLVDGEGLIPSRFDIGNDYEAMKEFIRREPLGQKIKAIWHESGEYSWTYETEIPHVTFDILEDGVVGYCRGIIFSIKDILPYEGFCTVCGFKVKRFEDLDTDKCPGCGSKSVPCSFKEQVKVDINWHELHVLCTWAERWGHEQCGGAGSIYGIALRLQQQFPEKGCLTLAGEVNELKKEYPGLEHNVPGAE